MSKQLDEHQQNWHCFEKEVYAVVFALEKWNEYLLEKKLNSHEVVKQSILVRVFN